MASGSDRENAKKGMKYKLWCQIKEVKFCSVNMSYRELDFHLVQYRKFSQEKARARPVCRGNWKGHRASYSRKSLTITLEKYTDVTKYKTKNELASDNGKKHDCKLSWHQSVRSQNHGNTKLLVQQKEMKYLLWSQQELRMPAHWYP